MSQFQDSILDFMDHTNESIGYINKSLADHSIIAAQALKHDMKIDNQLCDLSKRLKVLETILILQNKII